MSVRPKIVLLGMLSKMPVGGVAWLVAQYAIGFERLGCDVYYVEAHARTPSMFVTGEGDDGSEHAAAYLAELMQRFGLTDRWAFHALHADGRCLGMTQGRLSQLYREAALILNMHGGTLPTAELAASGRLALLGTDPVELELEIERGDARALEFLEAHCAYFTWGLNYGNPDCSLPWAERYPFVPSPPPVVLDFWANRESPDDAPFTTIGNWRQRWREVNFRGQVYAWSKHHEFLKILDLPQRSHVEFELALSSYEEDDRRHLERHGWRVRSGLDVSNDHRSYRDYIIGSRGELTVAKDQNIRFRSGWFSERSATYLAAGRPVIMQDTGFGNALPTGEGLLPFTDLDSAAAAVEVVAADDKRHRIAATEIAREYLDSEIVLASLLDHMGITFEHRPRRRDARFAAAELAATLRLVPRSRRPLVLAAGTEDAMRGRPIPTLPPQPDGPPAASVVVVVLDNLPVTRLALESVLVNTNSPSYELLVVDNGSAPPTRQYLSVLAARNRHVRILRDDHNRGFAAGANRALALARGDIVVLLNNDTIVPPRWLEALRDHLEDPAIGVVGPATNRCGNEAEVPTDYETYGELLEFVATRRPAASFDIPVATMFCAAFRREVLSVVGLLDERFEIALFEDDDFSRRVREAGFRVKCAPDIFVHHFGEASLGQVAAEGRYGELFESNRRRFEEKWGELWTGHHRLPDPSYESMVLRMRARVGSHVRPGSVIAVVSRGDDELLRIPDCDGWHFPRRDDGGYAGHHPADDTEAIGLLEALRAEGAGYLAVPATALWWLEHYDGFAGHLERRYRRILAEPDTAYVYELEEHAS